ncbi:MAG: YjbH domain-containing protein [Bacteroidales bacterium]
MKICLYTLLTCFFLSFSIAVQSQSDSGIPGYVRIPVATFHEDGSLLFGASFLPKEHLSYSKYNRDALAVYANLTFLSFIEVDLRVTRQLNVPSGTSHVVDRVPTVRFRILKEQKWVPAVAVGFHDVLTSIETGTAHHFGATYVVVTKNFHLAPLHLNVGTTAGWGMSKFIWKSDEFIGFFGGISLGIDRVKWMQLLCDYDGVTINAGLRATLFKRLCLTAGTINFDSFTGTISYRFSLLR